MNAAGGDTLWCVPTLGVDDGQANRPANCRGCCRWDDPTGVGFEIVLETIEERLIQTEERV